jgi:hypothetical protein
VERLLAKAQRDFYAPLVQTQAGKQAERLVAGTRDTVASIMLDALTEGWSVPERLKSGTEGPNNPSL